MAFPLSKKLTEYLLRFVGCLCFASTIMKINRFFRSLEFIINNKNISDLDRDGFFQYLEFYHGREAVQHFLRYSSSELFGKNEENSQYYIKFLCHLEKTQQHINFRNLEEQHIYNIAAAFFLFFFFFVF